MIKLLIQLGALSILGIPAQAAFTVGGTFSGEKTITTTVAGTTDVTASFPTLNTANYGSFYDAVSNTIGGGAVSGNVWAYWDAKVNNDWANGTADYGAIDFYRGAIDVLGVGNNWGAWAYSTFGTGGDRDLLRPSDNTFIHMDNNTHRFLVMFTFNPGANDTATVWLDPNMSGPMSSWATQVNTVYTTTVTGDLSFNTIRARSGSTNNLNSWTFSNLVLTVPEPSRPLMICLALCAFFMRRRK